MSEYLEMKKAFYEAVVAHGITGPEQFPEAFPLGVEIEKGRLERWLRHFLRVDPAFTSQRRYVNRFKLGADPEFVFAQIKQARTYVDDSGMVQVGRPTETQYPAHSVGLKQGPAFGMDNNGRLVEVRPHPSRSALDVCASMLTTLRWMAALYPASLGFPWKAGAFLFNDGVGGHVHFGRKRPSRQIEVRALDNICAMLIQLGCYPAKECADRAHGDARGQRYGMPGDFRLQAHGYEYRTYPSWLDSPGLAFLTLTLSKLAVYKPSLVRLFNEGRTQKQQFHRLLNLLAYYHGLDDDAKLAFLLVRRGLPIHGGGDFKPRWGLGGIGNLPKMGGMFVPLSIKPDAESRTEMMDHIRDGKPLTWRMPEPTWSPQRPPKGYFMLLDNTETLQQKGLGEMVHDMCGAEGEPLNIRGGSRGTGVITIADLYTKRFPPGWEKKVPVKVEVSGGDRNGRIYIPPEFREGAYVRQVRDFLLNGWLPIWKVGKVTEGSYKLWKDGNPTTLPKLKGKIIYEEGRNLL